MTDCREAANESSLPMPAAGTKPADPRRQRRWLAAELFGLWALAGAQPLFDLLRRGPEFPAGSG